eukprot:TRINITY_DN105214_c0_g1_i1.p1 TRINITY_DN105214_c0_g1~~TRINITY_DN105214_c0_g1_i1.p1  ORF type:complete len:359 (+),score=-32.66 TRINITY_DN105214_c0_g1_i1:14-1090(+)
MMYFCMNILILLFFYSSFVYSTIEHPFMNHDNSLCYMNDDDRFSVLKGQYVNQGYRSSRFWNLSCPLELSKHSCIHQGSNITRANHASYLNYVPSNCQLLSMQDMIPYFGMVFKKNMLFIGNSLLRQVFTGFMCELYAFGLVEDMNVEWRDCNRDSPFPCHGSAYCIQCGEHSGYRSANVKLRSGTEIRIMVGEDFADSTDYGKLKELDLIVVQHWVTELRGLEQYYDYNTKNNIKIPKLIWMPSWRSHFPQGGQLYYEKNHGYNMTLLSELKQEYGVIDCESNHFDDPNSNIIRDERLFKTKWNPNGFLFLQGTNSLGEYKVGNAVAKFGDCQHFCAPGPPGEMSRALIQLIFAIFK